MASASTHPRRTTKSSSSAVTPPSRAALNSNMSLRKGATFHSPSSPSTTPDHVDAVKPCLPRRAQTTLEDVVEAHQRRVALTLGDIDRSLSAIALDSSSTKQLSLFRDDSIPVPKGFLSHNVMSPPSDYTVGGRSLRPRRQSRRQAPQHESDSGLGSSVLSQTDSMCAAKSAVASSAITGSATTNETLPRLSQRASNRIHEHILKPLLAKSSLRDFHPIVQDCPRKIHDKEIVCLRDLEKTLMFMAPEKAKSAKLYLDFCLTSIRCIQATVEFLNEHEQTRPYDRPYTNGYFVDLVDQIRNYARSVQEVKEKTAKGESVDEVDAESSDEIKLYGGVSKTGRPAELVRVKKNGKAYSLADGHPVTMASIENDEKQGAMMKRSLSEQAADDEAIMRSMARRKRSASASELAPKRCKQPGCNKEFKRSCDLTKHEKTHSRPWKCDEPSCKYHEYGWPTEKELDRHVNDKHSSSPTLYKCLYEPCPYQSKRESNCKQHMEKSHGWTYVRSKSNGKPRKSDASSLPTPQTTTIQTPDSSAVGQYTPEDDGQDDFLMEDFSGSDGFDVNMYPDPQLTFPEYPSDGLLYETTSGLHVSPVESSLADTSPYNYNMDDIQANFGPSAGSTNDFVLYEQPDLYNARVHIPAQLPTPDYHIFQRPNDFAPARMNTIPHLSPVGQDTMLYTPPSMGAVDDTFDQYQNDASVLGHGQDFQLFSSIHAGAQDISSSNDSLFGEMPSAASGFSQTNSQEFFKAFYAANSGYDEGFYDHA